MLGSRRRVAICLLSGAFAISGEAEALASGLAKFNVTAALSPATVFTGASYGVTGMVTPAAAGQPVKLQQMGGGVWKTIASTKLSSSSKFVFNETAPTSQGQLTLRVSKPAAGGTAAGNSPTLTLIVASSSLQPGQTLMGGGTLRSTTLQYTLVMQTDGNLVLYVTSPGRALWASSTAGNPGAYAVMQTDGNLVVYSSSGKALWASVTPGHPGAFVTLQNDGNLVVYASFGTAALWSTNTHQTSLQPAETLNTGQYLVSPAEQYYLVMQGDGNLVLYVSSTNQPLWASNTVGNPGAHAIMQTDGNLVVYNSGGTALWASATAGHSGAYVAIQDDGDLVVYSAGRPLWSTNEAAASLHAGETLAAGASKHSSALQYSLVMQTDGNLVLYVASSGRALWASSTAGNPGAHAIMQTDGNLVVYSSSGKALWASVTTGHPGAFVTLQNDGNLVIYASSGGALWSTNTHQTSLQPGETLTTGRYLVSPAEQYYLVMQGDGNLVLYVSSTNQPLWASNTVGNPGAHVIMQTDGNFVVYSSGGTALWASATPGHSGAYAILQDDSLLNVDLAGQVLWSSNTSTATNPISTTFPLQTTQNNSGPPVVPCNGSYPFGTVLINGTVMAPTVPNSDVYSNYRAGRVPSPCAGSWESIDGTNTFGLKYQCTEWAVRWGFEFGGVGASAWQSTGGWNGSAYDMFRAAEHISGLSVIANGSGGAAPRPGDLIVWSGLASDPPGHVAVVVGVRGGSVYFVSQNGGVQTEFAMGYNTSTNYVSDTYVGGGVEGWIQFK